MATASDTNQAGSIAAGTTVGKVHLTLRDLAGARAYYEQLIGLAARERADGSVGLGPAGGPDLIMLGGDPSAQRRDPRQTGLYHLAILLPTRRDLAVALVRLAQGGWRIAGASDHGVSEALYLDDPEGNGIEIYRDRDRSEWSWDGQRQVQMQTLPLDLNDLLGELERAPIDPVADALMPAGTRIGHVHLQVAEIPPIEHFYEHVLGFDVTVRGLPGALFVSAGGYHHHVGMNTWHSRGGSTPPERAVGLRAYELKVGDADALGAVLARLADAGTDTERAGDGTTLVRDPSGNRILLTV